MTIIIKIGGGESINLGEIIKDLNFIKESIIIVHGANATRDNLLQQLGIKKKILVSEAGFSSVYSNEELLNVNLMTYSGLTNKRIVELLHQHRYNPIGLTGADAGLISGIRNKGIKTVVNGKRKIIRDLSGKPHKINSDFLLYLLQSNYVPVITIPLIDENGILINSENDDIVSILCEKLEISRVYMLIEATGLMDNLKDETTIIRKLSILQLENKLQNSSGRIKRKLLALKKIVSTGTEVFIGDGRVEKPLQYTSENGTWASSYHEM